MENKNNNPYFIAREKSGLTRREVAMTIATSEASLCEYEYDKRPVPDDLALEMSLLYKAPWLRIQHLLRNKVFKSIFGNFPEMGNKERDVLVAQKEVADVVGVIPDIIKETLTENEFNERIYRECHEAIKALMMLIYKQKAIGCEPTADAHKRAVR